jgi:hypothetical protein
MHIKTKFCSPVDKTLQKYVDSQYESGRQQMQNYVLSAYETNKRITEEKKTQVAVFEETLKVKEQKYQDIAHRVDDSRALAEQKRRNMERKNKQSADRMGDWKT